MAHYRHLVARLQRSGFPARLHQNERRGHLDIPSIDAALVIGHFELDPGMRIGPLELLDCPHQRHVLGAVEAFHGMMRERHSHCKNTSDQRLFHKSSFNECLPISMSRSAYARSNPAGTTLP